MHDYLTGYLSQTNKHILIINTISSFSNPHLFVLSSSPKIIGLPYFLDDAFFLV